jgi:meso-butanediol dehydrogenase / (S,S)-butanediol dehydrogenase / diacetyl reductase
VSEVTHVIASGAPPPKGPYAHAALSGDLIVVGAQIGTDPESGELVPGGAAAQTDRAFRNLEAVLSECGAGFDDVIRVGLLLVDGAALAEINAVYERYVANRARATAVVSALPRGASVSVELLARRPSSRTDGSEPAVLERSLPGGGSQFTGSTVLITGGGHGIGRACARRFARAGACVVVVDRDLEGAEETCRLVRRDLGTARALWADVSQEREVADVVENVMATERRIDVLVANAGILVAGSVTEAETSDWDDTFAVNVRSQFLLARLVIPHMLAAEGGAIVNMASTSGLIGEPRSAAYNSSKAAVINLTRQLAVDYSGSGIRINAVCPGWVDTGFNAPILVGVTGTELAEHLDRTVPMRRQGTPDEIAEAVAFLASDNASYITGHALVVDGGMTVI